VTCSCTNTQLTFLVLDISNSIHTERVEESLMEQFQSPVECTYHQPIIPVISESSIREDDTFDKKEGEDTSEAPKEKKQIHVHFFAYP
jgi:hypothetical protein